MKYSKETEFVCVFGWDETLYQAALEDSRFYAFVCEEERQSTDPRIRIFTLESPLQIDLVAKKIGWFAVLKKMEIVLLQEAAHFKQLVETYHLAAHLILSEASDWSVSIVRNAKANWGVYRRGLDLNDAFKGIPALIVGAGPSLEKNGHLIKEFEQKGLIFAGGSSLNVIDVEPHFAASIDGQAPYRQFKTQPYWQTPFCYQSRMNPENVSLLHGETLHFPDGFSKLINWFYDEDLFDSGWTVGNFLIAVAEHFGCSPIILVGMDFCYAANQKYAQIGGDIPEGLIQHGEYLTQRDWLMAAKWTEERTSSLINATEGGMLKIPREPLQQILDRLPSQDSLRQKVHKAVQGLTPQRPKRSWNELDREILSETLLEPLWHIWKPLFEREAPHHDLQLHQTLFFQQILEEHGLSFLSEPSSLLPSQ